MLPDGNQGGLTHIGAKQAQFLFQQFLLRLMSFRTRRFRLCQPCSHFQRQWIDGFMRHSQGYADQHRP